MQTFFKSLKKALAASVLLLAALINVQTVAAQHAKTLLGAGSTLVYPLFSKMFAEYNKKTGIQVNYQSIGSGGGILQLANKTVDFGPSDGPLNDEQTAKISV